MTDKPIDRDPDILGGTPAFDDSSEIRGGRLMIDSPWLRLNRARHPFFNSIRNNVR